MSATTRRRLIPRIRVRRPRIGPRRLAAALGLVAVLVGAFFWVRQSPLVAVQEVTVTGVSGPDAGLIRSSLIEAAEGMSTMHLDAGRLRAAVARYPVVRSLHLSADFPHGLRISVSEQIPVAVLVTGAQRTTVSADGTLLPASHPETRLPSVTTAVAPGGTHVTGATFAEVKLLAAAPYRILARTASAELASGLGLAVTLRDGPAIYFGDGSQLKAKWRAAIAVLASGGSDGASYIDVTDPGRPAAGTGSDGSSATAATPGATAGDSSTAGGDPASNSTSTTG